MIELLYGKIILFAISKIGGSFRPSIIGLIKSLAPINIKEIKYMVLLWR
jgi:hypothetical protein